MATGTVVEAVEAVTEEVATNLEEVAQATRQVDAKAVSFFAGGLGVGIAIGFFFGYRFNKEKIKAEAFKQSQEEVDAMREVYQQKILAAEPKPSVEEVIEERGYSVAADKERPLPAPVPILVAPIPTLGPKRDKDKDTGWDYPTELAKRTQEEPYIIHEDEMRASENGYPSVNYTYYAEDDVLVDEDERPLPHGDLIVGQDNLRFGHGSDSQDVVFVRNDRLELDMEICRSPGSYEREVIGLEIEHSDRGMERRRHSRRRNRFEDESS